MENNPSNQLKRKSSDLELAQSKRRKPGRKKNLNGRLNTRKCKIISDESTPTEENENKITHNETQTLSIPNLEIFDITEKITNSAIYYREKERQMIIKFIVDSTTKSLFICGQPGTGKTSLVLDIFKTDINDDDKFCFKIYLNCMSLTSIETFFSHIFGYFNQTVIYEKMMKQFTNFTEIASLLKQTPNQKNVFELLALLNQNLTIPPCPIILLDEVDYFYEKNKDILFYDIINLPYLTSCELKLMMISNNSEFDREILPKIANRKIEIEKIVFKPYTHIEIFEILKKKLTEMNCMRYFHEESLRFLSSKLNKLGDIRPVLEVVKTILLNYKVEFEKNGKIIDLKEIFTILKQKNINLNQIISSLTIEQKIIVIAVYFLMSKLGKSDLEEKQIYDQYRTVKKENFSQELSIEEFREVIKSFCDIGLLEDRSQKTKSKIKTKNIFRVKYSAEDLEIIFADDTMFKMFKPTDKDQ